MLLHSPLLTDQYQLVMAYGYWRLNLANTPAVFNLTFRANPFLGNYTIACGLADVIDYLKHYRFDNSDINYLATLTYPDGMPLFDDQFLMYLEQLTLDLAIDAVPEGEIVFAKQPLLRVQGPLLQCQLLETTLLNLVNLPSLVATKASRLYIATEGDPIMEFGLRRAQGIDGGITASRAAYVGGCASTSNLMAGKLFNIPVQGTQAHSWVMVFTDELSAFNGFAHVMQQHTVLLIDTYGTHQGIIHAIEAGKRLRHEGHELYGVRLDSGNLNELSHFCRRTLDQAGFTHTKIIASGDLDEYKIAQLKSEGAPIDAWGVGTKLVTAYDYPALDVAYKLGAIQEPNGEWDYKIKISDQHKKRTLPGFLQTRRFFNGKRWLGDVIYDTHTGCHGLTYHATQGHAGAPTGSTAEVTAGEDVSTRDLLVPIFRHGKCVYTLPSLAERRAYCLEQLNAFLNYGMEEYHVEIDEPLFEIMNQLAGDE